MVNKGRQVRTKRKTERLFTGSCPTPFVRLEKELAGFGYIEKGADPVVVAMEHKDDELYLEIEKDETGCVHSYLLVTFDEKNRKQRKYRW